MSKLSRIQHWAGENEEVYVAVVRQRDTSIPDKHWGSFVDGAEHRFTEIFEATQEALERAYEDWKDEDVCSVCDETFDECDCEPDEEEEDSDSE